MVKSCKVDLCQHMLSCYFQAIKVWKDYFIVMQSNTFYHHSSKGSLRSVVSLTTRSLAFLLAALQWARSLHFLEVTAEFHIPVDVRCLFRCDIGRIAGWAWWLWFSIYWSLWWSVYGCSLDLCFSNYPGSATRCQLSLITEDMFMAASSTHRSCKDSVYTLAAI